MEKLSKSYIEKCRQALLEQQATSFETTDNWAHVDRDATHKDWDILCKSIASKVDDFTADDPLIQRLMMQHYDIACRFFTPSKQAYIAMGLFYIENEEMENFHNKYHPELATFLQQATAIYAEKNL